MPGVPVPGVVVLGMHRSGTSAVSRILNLLGADLGPESDLLTEYDNPAGHWESKALVACNDRILAAFGRSWDFPPWLAPGWEYTDRASELLPELTETFTSVFHSGPWAWKDPRTCLTFPLWRRVLGGEVTVVLVLRAPGAVVTSVKRRDGIPNLYAIGLWHHYVRAAVAGSRGLPVVCLQFEDVVASPLAAVEALVSDLGALGVELDGDPVNAAASMQDDLVHGDEPPPLVRRLTSSTVE
ncbi:MAG TPA: sulfotransferase, partial [Acidimicrobiales bacterium]